MRAKLLAPAVVVPEQIPQRPFWSAQHLGVGAIVSIRPQVHRSPLTHRKNELYVRWADVVGRVTHGWLAEGTPVRKVSNSVAIRHQSIGYEDRVSAWNTLRFHIARAPHWNLIDWLCQFGFLHLPLLHAVIRELGGAVPRSDDPLTTITRLARLITHKEHHMKVVQKDAPKTVKRTVASKNNTKTVQTAAPKGRASEFTGQRIIRLKKENPRREGSKGYQSWEVIEKGMTYEQYIEAGGRRVDLAWDIAHGNIRMK